MIAKLNDIKEAIRYRLAPSRIMSNYVKVEVSASCNARCVWCWMFKSPHKPQGLMRLEDFRKFIDINRNYFRAHKIGVMPFFNGECLIHPEIFGFLDYIVRNRIRLMDLDTNFGMEIDVPKLMSYPFKHIRVNIGGMTKDVHERAMDTDFGLVVKNMRQAFAIDAKRMFVKMVVTKSNYDQIGKMGEFIRDLGGDPEHIIIAPTGFPLPAVAEEKDIKEFFDEIVSEKTKEYLKFDYDLDKPKYDIRAKEKGCHFLLNSVTYDGKLTICCQDQFEKINLGNAFETPLIELVSTPAYAEAIRKAKNMEYDFCKECN